MDYYSDVKKPVKSYATFYSKVHPCPICGRYKTAYKNKCFGFITTNEAYAYCSREENDSKKIVIFGQTCYRHPLVTIKPY